MKSVPYVTSGWGSQRPRAAPRPTWVLFSYRHKIKCSGYSRSKIPQLPSRMEEEEFQEADVLWPWPDTPPPSPEEEEGSHDYDLPAAAARELYEYDTAIAFSCEPFSEPAASWSASSTNSTLSALPSSDWSDGGGGFFLSGPSTVSAAGLELDATEEFLEADVLWPDTDADDEAEDDEFLWRRRRSRRIEEAAASAAAAVFCGKREGCSRPLVASSPIDIPMATRGAAAARRRRP